MKLIKLYLIVVTVLLLGAIASGVYVWYVIQKLDVSTAKVQEVSQQTPTTNTQSSTNGSTATGTSGTVQIIETQDPIIVDVNTLAPLQQKILENFGYKGGAFTITPTMMLCAKKAVGDTRYQEIITGSAPTTLESIKLLPCFKVQ